MTYSITLSFLSKLTVFFCVRFECRLLRQNNRTLNFTECSNATYHCSWTVCGRNTWYENKVSGLQTPGVYQFWIRAIDKVGFTRQAAILKLSDDSAHAYGRRWNKPQPCLTTLANRHSWDIHEGDLQFDRVISCNIEFGRVNIDATRGVCALWARARVADQSQYRMISRDRTVHLPHEYLGCNDFHGPI